MALVQVEALLKQEKNVLLNQGVPQTRPVGRKT